MTALERVVVGAPAHPELGQQIQARWVIVGATLRTAWVLRAGCGAGLAKSVGGLDTVSPRTSGEPN